MFDVKLRVTVKNDLTECLLSYDLTCLFAKETGMLMETESLCNPT